jgi:hypothetical protein
MLWEHGASVVHRGSVLVSEAAAVFSDGVVILPRNLDSLALSLLQKLVDVFLCLLHAIT